LKENFFSKKKIVPFVAAGNTGMGKSTYLSAAAALLNPHLKNEPFKTSNALNSCTHGIWVYPRPLCVPCHPDVQIMLIDLEGMLGTRMEEQAH
jgi:hypothetical protein